MLGCVYSHLLSVGKDQRVRSACFRPCHHRVFALTGSEVSLCHWAQTQPQHPEPTRGRVEQARSRRHWVASRSSRVGQPHFGSSKRRLIHLFFQLKRTFKLSEVNLEKPFGLPCVCCVSGSVQFNDGHSAQSPRLHGPPPVSTDAVTWQCRHATSLTRFQSLCVFFVCVFL